MKKKLLFAFVALLTTASAWADVWQDPVTKVNYEYTVGESEASVKAGFSYSAGSPDATGDITILQKFSVDEKEYTVTSIGNYAFRYCTGLTSVTIPSSVTTISKYTFYMCSGLTSITIPESVTSIDAFTFEGCSSLTSINIPSSVTSISDRAFCECSSLSNINIPSSVTSISDRAFYKCSSLTSINIPSSVTSIGSFAFYGTAWYNEHENGILYLDNWLLGYKSKPTGNLIIEDDTKGIASSAFFECSGLTSITIPSSVTSIGIGAFYGCSGLTSINIPSSVTSIGENSFSGTAWYNEQADGILYLDNWLLGYKGDKPTGNLIIKDGTKGIVPNAFYECSGLTSINIPKGVTSIGYYAFYKCSSLTSINIPEGVTSIGKSAFSDCSNLTSITIPNSVTNIGDFTFRECSGLTSVTIPNSMTSISTSAFQGCSNLSELTVQLKLDKSVATYSTPYGIDFSTAVSGLKAYTVMEVKDGKAVLQEVTSKVSAGTGLILKGTAGETYNLTGDVLLEGSKPETNLLVGVNADTEIGGNDVDYILQNGKFVKAVAGTLKAGKAYLKLDAALAREIIEIDGETTGISLVENGKRETENVFDLQGRRVNKPSKGMYIVNGKKVVMN